MQLDLVSIVDFEEYRKIWPSRREVIKYSCAGAAGITVSSAFLTSKNADATAVDIAIILAKYMFKRSGLLLPAGELAVKVSQEIRAWVLLINDGGLDRLQQKMTASLHSRDGSIEDQQSIAIEIPPRKVATYHASASARDVGTKNFDFRTEADQTILKLKVT